MYNFKNSLMTLVGLLALIGAIAIVTPFKGYSQQNPEATTATSDVRVVNPATAPVLTLDAPTQVLQREIDLSFANDISIITDKTLSTVPAGKKLVIENASVFGTIPQGQKVVAVLLRTTVNSFTIDHPIPIQQQQDFPAGSSTLSLANASLRLYATAGTTIKVSAIRNTTGGVADVKVAISGYLVNAPN